MTVLKTDKSEKLSDEELVEAAKSGSAEAWEEIIFRYRNLIHPKNETKFLVGAEENDVVQERLLGFYFAVKKFNIEKNASFPAFAKRCGDNQLSTAITAALRKKHSPLNSYVSLDKEADNEESGTMLSELISVRSIRNPEEILIDRENKDDIEYKINRELSNLEVTVLSLYLGGWSYREIAAQIGKDEKAVDNAMQRIKKRLRNRKCELQ